MYTQSIRIRNLVVGIRARSHEAVTKLVKEIKAERIAEIGVWKAEMAYFVLTGCNTFIKEYIGVDPYRVFDGSCAQTKERGDKIFLSSIRKMREFPQFFLIKEMSLFTAGMFPDKYFDLVYIDADHRYEAVSQDIKAWMPKVKDGGILCGHDYYRRWMSVKKAVQEVFGEDCEKGRGTGWIARMEKYRV